MTFDATLSRIFVDLDQADRRREAEAAQRDPLKHRLTRVFAAGVPANYRYFNAGKDGRGRRIFFCTATHRNAAGFFLTWRQVETETMTKRDQWSARRKKKDAKAIARKRLAAFREKRSKLAD